MYEQEDQSSRPSVVKKQHAPLNTYCVPKLVHALEEQLQNVLKEESVRFGMQPSRQGGRALCFTVVLKWLLTLMNVINISCWSPLQRKWKTWREQIEGSTELKQCVYCSSKSHVKADSSSTSTPCNVECNPSPTDGVKLTLHVLSVLSISLGQLEAHLLFPS